MLHDPTTRRLYAEARNEELRRYAKPRVLTELDGETAEPRKQRRLRRFFPG